MHPDSGPNYAPVPGNASCHPRNARVTPSVADFAKVQRCGDPDMSETTLFLVRVWRQVTAFRASVRRVDDGDTQLFQSAYDMAHYLDTTTRPTKAAGARDDPTGCETHGSEER
jgi:hypothetical protein